MLVLTNNYFYVIFVYFPTDALDCCFYFFHRVGCELINWMFCSIHLYCPIEVKPRCITAKALNWNIKFFQIVAINRSM